jgi:hypothetical protein
MPRFKNQLLLVAIALPAPFQNQAFAHLTITAQKSTLIESELCGIFTKQNMKEIKWIDAPETAKVLAEQSSAVTARGQWHDLPKSIRCGKNRHPVPLVAINGTNFESYAVFDYPPNTFGVGSDLTYVALKGSYQHRALVGGSGICTFDGMDNKWFQSRPAKEGCITMELNVQFAAPSTSVVTPK